MSLLFLQTLPLLSLETLQKHLLLQRIKSTIIRENNFSYSSSSVYLSNRLLRRLDKFNLYYILILYMQKLDREEYYKGLIVKYLLLGSLPIIFPFASLSITFALQLVRSEERR